jgi:hypothetical protein
MRNILGGMSESRKTVKKIVSSIQSNYKSQQLKLGYKSNTSCYPLLQIYAQCGGMT